MIVADAFRGLLSIAPDGTITELAVVADGVPIRYADDVDVAADGKIYFSDASTKFCAKDWAAMKVIGGLKSTFRSEREVNYQKIFNWGQVESLFLIVSALRWLCYFGQPFDANKSC
ncbi:MAG: hypothetical protein KJ823_05555, partial [Proteobacteria bacterium]|nr:hypothetical protein [Pseudomonadota bacterium]